MEIQERCRKWSTTHSPKSHSGSATAMTEPAEAMPVIPTAGSVSLSTNSGDDKPKSTSNDTAPASSDIHSMLGDGQRHVFVVGHPMDVIDDSGTECALSEGDALQLASPPPSDATASLVVLSSKATGECARSTKIIVTVADLQEMQNHM